jgi:L-threonate 2-dehydrogenase
MPDNTATRPSVAIVSPGQMGAAIGARLTATGVRVVTAEGRSDSSTARALAAGIEIVPLSALADTDFIFSIVPPAAAVQTARSISAVLGKGASGPLYIDWNAVSPARAKEVENIIATAGGRFTDGGIIGLAPGLEGPGPLFYASGPEAPALSALEGRGVRFKILDAPNGAASALKMSYAGITKGTIALGAAMILAAKRAGAAEALLAEMAASQANALAGFRRSIPDMFGKAGRWAPELREIADFVGDARVESGIYTAIAALYEHLAADDNGPHTDIDVLAALLQS